MTATRSVPVDRDAALRLLQPVDSSNLDAVGYDEDARILYVRFRGTGRLYAYFDVQRDVACGLRQADSKGRYFNNMIRDVYPFERLY